eukprot:CAMPEP_0168597920 /NCGR_PEP_ID=MMETSP0420-20121227/11025_1 /TAXON_ID=498008 /ORGANISM="Pessonella sp." /LENGTH=135 /DNA_ID=CAMNT_0008635011 /DNA_START=148 /DNA_END=552 /DNA_ORIENTATION=+
MKCPRCSSQFTIKTDPENSDYVSEWGCTRNFEKWKTEGDIRQELQQKQDKEEENDAMRALENRTRESKIEMDILDGLDEIRSLNARNSKLTIDQVLNAQSKKQQDSGILDEEEVDETKKEFLEAKKKLEEQQSKE